MGALSVLLHVLRSSSALGPLGPLLNPLIVYCPSESELKRWLYHLDKQIHLNGGNLDGSFLTQVSEWV